jgi:signal transduction histidine kinase
MTRAASSLRFRFIAGTIALVAVGLAGTGYLMAWLMKVYIAQGYHDEMEVHIEEVAALVRVAPTGQPFMIRKVSDPRFLVKKSGFYWEIQRQGFEPIHSPSLVSGNLSGKLAVDPKPRWEILSDPTGDALEYGMTRPAADGGPPLRISIASDMRLLDDNLDDFTTPMLWALLGFAFLLISAGAAQIAYGLRPLKRLAQGIADINAGRSQRMSGDFPKEVAPLVDDINALLETNTEIVSRARLQAGNLAHGLRTPLAILVDEAEHLESIGQVKSAAALRRECDRMRRQIDYNLARARSAVALPIAGRHVSLQETLNPLLSAMPRLHAGRNVTITVAEGPDLSVLCDDVDLGEILSNIIDNACKWCASSVHVSWQKRESAIEIIVEDDGPGIPEINRIEAIQAWKRLDEAKPGTGLGLAITVDLLKVHHGSLRLSSSTLGGLRVTMCLPFESVTGSSALALPQAAE